MKFAFLCCQVVRALESEADRAGLYQGMKPGQRLEDQSEYGSDYGGTRRYEEGSGEFDVEYNGMSGLRAFHKKNNVLPSILSGDHTIAEESEQDYDNVDYDDTPEPAPAFKPPTFGSKQFSLPKIKSGEYDPDTESSDVPGAFRPPNGPPSYAPPRAAGFPNNGMSGFMGAPPPPPGRYSPAAFTDDDYTPIGKTVSFAPHVEEKKF